MIKRGYINQLPILLLFISITLVSCKEDPVSNNNEPSETEILNGWIWYVMNDIYFWADEINQDLYPTDENNPEQFFYSLLNDNDRFSWIVDDYQALINSFNNIELSTGMSPYFIRLGNTSQVIVVIEYVSPASPADSAGIKRGDIITRINGEDLNLENYAELFYSESLTLEFGALVNSEIVPAGEEVTITARVIEQNPVVHHEIINYENTKIGYIAYTGFSLGENNKWQDSIDLVFSEFKNEGVTELIFDIRYNPGGRVSVANHIASSIAPENVPGSGNVFVKYNWNDVYNNYFLEEEGEDSPNLVVLFDDAPTVNLNLEKAYFLTSPHSASASELIIIGLDPYMEVVQIGENTYGKSYGSVTIPDTEDTPRHNWAMQPIVFQFSNADGFTGFSEGVVPDYEIIDDMLFAKPFGDITDPIIARALEDITGVSPLAKKKQTRIPVNYEIMKDPVREAKSVLLKEFLFKQ